MSDVADRADVEIERDKARELDRIKNSLADSGIINCVDCGDEIPKARKIAVPSCTRCIDCEELRG